MQITYDVKRDLLYIRMDDRKPEVINRRLSEDVVLDVGAEEKIVGIEILDTSKHLNLESVLPVKYHVKQTAVWKAFLPRRNIILSSLKIQQNQLP